MPANFSKCPRCQKIFAAQPGKALCAKCNTEFIAYGDLVLDAIEKHSLRKPDEIAEFTGVPLEAVNELIESSSLLSHEIADIRMCVGCKERPAQKHAEYCFHCRLTLNKAFSDAVKLMSEIQERESRLKRSNIRREELLPSLNESLDSKRVKKNARRPDPTPKSRYST